MLPTETILTFVAASLLLAAAPGPDNLFVLMQSAVYGAVAGLLVTIGLCTGLVVHSAAVALGVAAVIQASPVALAALKLAGAGYLIYLAWQAFRTKPASPEAPEASEPSSLSYGRLYGRGIVMNVTNPKVSVFFLAFLPQFVDAQRGPVVVQVLLLGGLFMASTLVVFGAVAFLAGVLREKLMQSARAQVALNRVAAAVFVGLAVKLLI